MIFSLHFALIMGGYCAVGLLLGSYMKLYTGASDLDLGFVFMIQPFAVFARPFICARADRFRSHKRLLLWCLLSNVIAYIPFIAVPFLLRVPALAETLTPQLCFWILVVAHLIGSFGFCGIRSLGDSLAVNHAKRVGSDFTMYRKYGSISFGICGYLLGTVNQSGMLPDFVPAMIVYVSCMALEVVLVYLWPDEFFVMVARREDGSEEEIDQLPSRSEILTQIRSKLKGLMLCSSNGSDGSRIQANLRQSGEDKSQKKGEVTQKHEPLSLGQQIDIFLLLMRRDIRLPLFLLFICYGGLVGYAPPNFVFTYTIELCKTTNTCDGSSLSGLMMICYCVTETTCYFIINALRKRLNYTVMLQITLVSLAFHYYFYGFLLPHMSPYFLLIESLHGLEYSSSLSTSCELGHKFANEVELLIPELVQRGIISHNSNQELVKVSLMATMNSCFTLVYDGVGCILGSLILGVVVDHYSYTTAWIVIGTLATIGFILVLAVVLIGKCLNIEPQITSIGAASPNVTVSEC